MPRSVETLFERFRRRGDAAALGKVFDRTASDLLRVAMHFARHPVEAEDLLQETFLTAIDRADAYDPSRPLVPWLVGILKNHARASRRKKQPVLWDLAASGEPVAVREPWCDVAWTDEVAQAVESLGEPYREVLVLLLRHEETPARIALLLDRPPATVRSQIHRGLDRLRRRLSPDARSGVLSALPLAGGLGGVRAEVLAHAAQVGAATGITSGTLLLAGGLTMTKKTLWTAALLATLLVGGIGALQLADFDRSGDEDQGPSTLAPPSLEGVPRDASSPTLAGRGGAAAAQPAASLLPSPVDLSAVDRMRDLHGVVVKADGSPVPGAEIQVLSYPWREQGLLIDACYDLVVPGPRTQSARDGSFVLRLEPGALVTLRVRAAGLASFEGHRFQAGERADVVLERPARLQVEVRGPRDEPVPDTRIRFIFGGGREDAGLTGEDGRCVFADLEPHTRVWLDVLPPRFGYPGWVDTTTGAPGELTVLLITLRGGRTLRGRVTAADSGGPIAGARVGMSWRLSPEVRTDAEGRYALPGWTGTGLRDLHVLADGFARGAAMVGAETDIDFELAAGIAARGRVIDARKRPVVGARVSAIGYQQPAPMGSRMSLAEQETDAEGRFHLEGLTPGMPHTLIAAAPGYGRRLVDFDTVAKGVVDLGDVALGAERKVAGVVLDAEDAPLPRVDVRLTGANEDRASRRDGQPAQTSYGVTLERATDDLGRFLFPDLSPGAYTLRIRQPGGLWIKRQLRIADQSLEGLKVRLEATREVVVRVEDASGQPVIGAHVRARDPRTEGHAAQTDANGEARLYLPEGRIKDFSITAQAPAEMGLLVPPPKMLEGDEGSITFVLQAADRVTGLLVTVDGQPLPGVYVEAHRAGERIAFSTRTVEDGSFSVRVAAGKPVDLVFDGDAASFNASKPVWPGYVGRENGVEVGAKDVVVTAHRVKADRILDVRVLDPDGQPIEGATVQAYRAPAPLVQAVTDVTGECRLRGLRAARVAVSAYLPPSSREALWVLAPLHVEVVPEGQRLDLRYRLARRIRGLVRAPEEGALRRRTVRLEREDGTLLVRGFVERRGRFVLLVPVDEPGPLTIVAEAQRADGTKLAGRAACPPPEADDLEIQLAN